MFTIHPSTKVIDSISYQKLVDSRHFEATDPDSNSTELEDESEKFTEVVKLTNALIGIRIKENFQTENEFTARVDIELRDCSSNQSFEGSCIKITIEKHVGDSDVDGSENEKGKEDGSGSIVFPGKIEFFLNESDLQSYMANISNYAFLSTMVIILSFFTMLGVIKQVTESQALAQSLSPISIGLNFIWNFFFFAINFQFSIYGDGEFMQYLGLPAFWYFISSFTFESRLFIVCWRSQLSQQ